MSRRWPVLLLVLPVVLAGCSQAPPPSPPASATTSSATVTSSSTTPPPDPCDLAARGIVTFCGYGPFRYGMDVDAAIAAGTRAGYVLQEGPVCATLIGDGISVILRDQRLIAVQVTAPGIRTDTEVGVGVTEGAVRRAYGTVIDQPERIVVTGPHERAAAFSIDPTSRTVGTYAVGLGTAVTSPAMCGRPRA